MFIYLHIIHLYYLYINRVYVYVVVHYLLCRGRREEGRWSGRKGASATDRVERGRTRKAEVSVQVFTMCAPSDYTVPLSSSPPTRTPTGTGSRVGPGVLPDAEKPVETPKRLGTQKGDIPLFLSRRSDHDPADPSRTTLGSLGGRPTLVPPPTEGPTVPSPSRHS